LEKLIGQHKIEKQALVFVVLEGGEPVRKKLRK